MFLSFLHHILVRIKKKAFLFCQLQDSTLPLLQACVPPVAMRSFSLTLSFPALLFLSSAPTTPLPCASICGNSCWHCRHFWAIQLLWLMSSCITMSLRPYSKIATAGNNERNNNSPSPELIWCLSVFPAVWHLPGSDNFCRLSNLAVILWHQKRAILACRNESRNSRDNSYK